MNKTISLFAAATLALAGCGKPSATQDAAAQAGDGKAVKLAYLPITHALPLVALADDPSVKVELVRYGSWPELLDALNTGSVDGASVLIELAMKAKERGVPLTAVALGHKSGNVVVVANDIPDAAALKGKTFAIPHRASSHHLLLRDTLKRGGLSIDDVNVVELPPPEMPSALAGGRISGYCVAEPFGSIGVASGAGRVLFQSDDLWPRSVCCGLVFNDKFLSSRPGAAASVLEAYHAQSHRLVDQDAALEELRKVIKQPDAVLRQSLGWIDYSDFALTEEDYATLVEKVKEYGVSENPPSYADFVKPNPGK